MNDQRARLFPLGGRGGIWRTRMVNFNVPAQAHGEPKRKVAFFFRLLAQPSIEGDLKARIIDRNRNAELVTGVAIDADQPGTVLAAQFAKAAT